MKQKIKVKGMHCASCSILIDKLLGKQAGVISIKTNYDYGIALDVLGVSQRMPVNSTIKIEFVAIQEGDFPFYCSVPCGEGIVDGHKRTHFDMVGNLHVRSAMSAME